MINFYKILYLLLGLLFFSVSYAKNNIESYSGDEMRGLARSFVEFSDLIKEKDKSKIPDVVLVSKAMQYRGYVAATIDSDQLFEMVKTSDCIAKTELNSIVYFSGYLMNSVDALKDRTLSASVIARTSIVLAMNGICGESAKFAD